LAGSFILMLIFKKNK